MTCSCAGPSGTVSPTLAPTWLTAEPRTTPQMRSPSASAALSRFNTTTPQPSPRTNPLAPASKALQRPSGDNMPDTARCSNSRRSRTACAPPASAMSASPRRSAVAARCTVTSDDAQAASTTMEGPDTPSTYATRPLTPCRLVPMLAYRPKAASTGSLDSRTSCRYSGLLVPV